MVTSFAPLDIRRNLTRSCGARWSVPVEHGPDGWRLVTGNRSVIVSCAALDDGVEWVHASIAGDELPSYDELKRLHAAVFAGYAYQVFAPPDRHVNIHPFALHLWGRLDGAAALPDFTMGSGSI